MRKVISAIFALIGWFAILAQYYLMVKNHDTPIAETTIRFFSFFTILTNLMIAVYFTLCAVRAKSRAGAILHNPGTLTAITAYITMVGLVYQFILRHTWQPKGLQLIVDELLHSVIPILVIIYWYLYERKSIVKYSQVSKWLLYPLIYLAYILARGSTSGFYPYPFVNVTDIGLSKVLLNSLLLIILFLFVAIVYIAIGKAISRNQPSRGN